MARRGALAGVTAVAAGAAMATYAMSPARRSTAAGDRHQALTAYLREHLSGADAAITIVRRLSTKGADAQDRQLFRQLLEELKQDRETVRALLIRLGASPRSAKRAAASVSGRVLSLAAGGEPGDLSLLRTLEGLSIGIQGKRCMWRALQELGTAVSLGRETFVALESRALRQWERVEERRRALAALTFPKLGPSAHPYSV